jgi:hypothetical protein
MERAGVPAFHYRGGSPAMPEEGPWVAIETTEAAEAGQAAFPQGLPKDLHNVVVYETPEAPLPSKMQNCLVGFDFQWPIES